MPTAREKKYLWSSSKFTEAFQIFQGSLPNRKGGFTTCHFTEHNKEFSQPTQGMVFFPMSSKKKQPAQGRIFFPMSSTRDLEKSMAGIWPESLLMASFVLSYPGKRPAVQAKGLSLLRKRLQDSLNHGPWEQWSWKQKSHGHIWVAVGGTERTMSVRASVRGRGGHTPSLGKALNQFGDLGTKISVALVFWFSVGLFSWCLYLYNFERVINT